MMCALPAEQPIANQSQSVWALHLAAGMCRRSIEYQGGVEGNLHQGGLLELTSRNPGRTRSMKQDAARLENTHFRDGSKVTGPKIA